jgi:two-component system CheB/CheR fusion protein
MTHHSLRILVVEDNRDSADTLAILLRHDGHDVAVAYTGPAGVEAAKVCEPDVLICDLGLPGLDGYGVVREVRRHPTTARALAIALTGYGDKEDRRRSRAAGFDAHLTKPADFDTLQGLLAGQGDRLAAGVGPPPCRGVRAG